MWANRADKTIKKRLTYLGAFLSGTVLTFGLAPFNIWPLAFLAPLGFYIFLNKAERPLLLSWFFGLGFWGAGMSWVYVSINEYGGFPHFLSPFLVLLFVGALAFLHVIQAKAWLFFRHSSHKILAFIALWVVFEWFRQWFLGGLPWLYIGYAFLETPLAGYAPVVGVYGVGLVAVITALSPVLLLRYPVAAVLVTVIGLWLVGAGLKTIEWTETSETVSVALVQGNISQEEKWRPENLARTLTQYKTQSEPYWENADIVLWPEAAIPMFYSNMRPYIEEMQAVVAQHKGTLVTGIPYDTFTPFARSSSMRYTGKQNSEYAPSQQNLAETATTDLGTRRFYNGIISLTPEVHVYKKQKLVAFGEFVPFAQWINKISPFQPIENFSRGTAQQSPLPYKKGRIAPFICFEAAYPNVVRRLAQSSDSLLTVSNDAWFGNSHGPYQHFQMVQMRALENQRYVIRSTNNGITAIVDKHGRVLKQLPRNQAGVLTGEIKQTHNSTPFTHWGSLPLIAMLLIGLLTGLLIGQFQLRGLLVFFGRDS